MKAHLRCFATIALLVLASAGGAGAGDLGLDISNGSPMNPGMDLNYGWRFRTTSEVVVTELGHWDEGSDGLVGSYPVGLWTTSGVLLGQTTISGNGTGSTMASAHPNGRWVFDDIPDVTLQPGDYIVGAFYRANPPDPLRFTNATDLTAGPNIAFVTSLWTPGATFVSPTSPISSTFGFFGPNFLLAGGASLPPLVDAGGPYGGDEGSAIALSGANASAQGGGALGFSWSADSPLCSFDDATALNPNLVCADGPGVHTVTLTVDDGQATASADASVTVNNVAPTVSSVTVPADPVDIGDQPVSVSASFSDPAGVHDAPFACTVDWGDGGGPQPATVSGTDCSASHTYAEPGEYQVTVAVTDKDGGTGSAVATDHITVLGPPEGFVTGGGWIHSPAGACKPRPGASGRANFSFVSKSNRGAGAPSGNTHFTLHAGGLDFHSSALDWLLVKKGNRQAQFKGKGRINDALGPGGTPYRFMLWAEDGAPDQLRIRIWYEDAGGEHDVYDNGTAQAIGGGSIVVHSGRDDSESPAGRGAGAGLEVHSLTPNPFAGSTSLEYAVSGPSARVEIAVFDLAGRRVRHMVSEFQGPGQYTATWDGTSDRGERVVNGVYFIRASVEGQQRVVRVAYTR